METIILDYGIMIKNTVPELIPGLVVINMRDSTPTGLDRVLVNIPGPMVVFMREAGKMGKETV
jgi:hypothetical protein